MLLLAWRLMPTFPGTRRSRLDGPGLALASPGIGVLASRGIAGRLTDQVGARWIAFTGMVVVALATLPFAFVRTGTREWWLVAALVVRGVGLGAVTIPVMTSAYLGLERAAVPHASIITRTAQQIGGSFGTAVLAVVLQRAIAVRAAQGLVGRAAAFGVAFWWSLAFTAAATVLVLRLPTGPSSVHYGG